ncbi:DUF6644 family protein [Methylotenera versatilis]|uniref:DUF6644 family protein n=1 Tax=Methylotenera versatilis TaxID=1055487 RepID=UPI000647EB83|nr:DUF6644 family protein [Methylotenera versatilis]
MSTESLFKELQNSSLSQSIGQLDSITGAFAQLFHIAGFLLILTAVLLVNLRLIGLGLNKQTIPNLAKATKPLVIYGLVLLLFSGLFTFLPSATLYYPNPAFWLKIYLFVFALIIQFTLYRKVTSVEAPNRILAGLTAVLSITLWFGVAFAGRAIGFLN